MYTELLVVGVTGLFLIWIYNKQKWPKNFPKGPTGLPIVGYLPWLSPSNLHVQLGKLGDIYGNVFSVKLGGETYVVMNDFEAIKQSMKMDAFAGRPNHLLAMDAIKNGIAYNKGQAWVEQRRFAIKTLRDFGFGKQSMEAMIQDSAADLVAYYRGKVNEPVVVREMFPIVALNCLWSMVAGEKMSMEDEKPRRIFHLGQKGIMEAVMQGPLYVMPWLAKIAPEMTGYNLLRDAKKQIDYLLTESIDEHKKTVTPGSPRDYIDMYLDKMSEATDPQSSFYRQVGVDNLIDTMLSFFMAGADTLTSTVDFTILYLLSTPKVLKKVQEEIDRVVGKSRVPSSADRQLMPYTEAVLQESFRLSSIAPGAILHSTMEDVEFMGHFLPKGTIVYPNMYQVHHDEKYWGDDVKDFRPERFINPDGSFRKDERVIPFGVGKRECPAAHIAVVEYFLFVTSILQAFDIKADPQTPLPSFEVPTAFVLSSNPYKVIFSERK